MICTSCIKASIGGYKSNRTEIFVERFQERLHIFGGHFGSGKTEVAVNFALRLAAEGKKVTIIDLDIVNPYFRTADAAQLLTECGVEVILPEFAGSNLDMPTVPQNIASVFYDKERIAVFDVGGDEDGAFALGRYNKFFAAEPYRFWFVANTKRPMTETAEAFAELADTIEHACRLRVTDIVNNTNLGAATDEKTLLSDYEELKRFSEMKGAPISLHCGVERALAGLPAELEEKKFEMEIRIKMPWQL